MGCRPSRRSTGRVGDFQHKRKNNNTYSYLKELSEQGIVKENFQSSYICEPSTTRKDKKGDISKEFNSFSTTSKIYFKPGLRSSKITVRLSTDGSTLEIEEFEIEPPHYTKVRGDDENCLLETRRASAPVLKFREGKKSSSTSICSPETNNMGSKMKLKENWFQIHRVDSLRAPLASVEADSISEDDEFDVANLAIAECDRNQAIRNEELIQFNGSNGNVIFCSPDENRICKCHEGNFQRLHLTDHSAIYNSDNQSRSCRTEDYLYSQIDNHCQRELSTENKVVFRDTETNAYEVYDKSLSSTLSSAYQLSADICEMKFNRIDVGSKDKAPMEEASGFNYDKKVMSAFVDHYSVLNRDSDTEHHLSLSNLPSTTWKRGNINITQSLDEVEGATHDYSMNFPSNAVLEFKFQNRDNIDDIDLEDKSIHYEDLHPCIVSSHTSDYEDSMTYTSANSDFLCSDDDEYSIPLCPCEDESVVYSDHHDHKVKHTMTLLN